MKGSCRSTRVTGFVIVGGCPLDENGRGGSPTTMIEPHDEAPPADEAVDWTPDALRAEAGALRERINRFRTSLGRFFVDKQELIDLMVLSAVAQEPLLIVGAPGTAKSELVLKFTQALGLSDADYFEYMLTRFTDPSEIIGPVDIRALRDGRYLRREAGKLPAARVAFLDEVFKSNSAVLNILLTIINERKFYQDGQPQPVRLQVLFAATNEIPDQAELAALKDRFTLKACSQSVHERHFGDLIRAGLQSEYHRQFQQRPWVERHCTLDDLLKAHRYLVHQLVEQDADVAAGGEPQDEVFPQRVFREFQRMVRTLVREDRMELSDRKIVKLYKLLRVRAWLWRGSAVSLDDLRLLQYIGNSFRDMEILAEKVPALLQAAGMGDGG